MFFILPALLGYLCLVAAQQVGILNPETHLKLDWTKCSTDQTCQKIQGQVTLDANFRWLHQVDSYRDCYSYGRWNTLTCNSNDNCTESCAIEGNTVAGYANTMGIKAINDSITLRYRTAENFYVNVGSRVHLMETKEKYQMFTLLNNEFTFDVNLSTVGCGINAALHFVAMDEDGGKAKFAGNKAGAEYGTGYCNSHCTRSQRFVGGKANFEGWRPSETDQDNGEGMYGACCPEFSVWDSNAHSFQFASNLCPKNEYKVCVLNDCDYYPAFSEESQLPKCDRWGCSYNPYQMGATDFYGKGKKVDTSKIVVTRFDEHQVTQFFIQDGKKIDLPNPIWDGLPKDTTGLSAEMCLKKPVVFDERDVFGENNGWESHIKLMKTPMILTMSILDDHCGYNLFLDSLWPPEKEGAPGAIRGDCLPYEDSEPWIIQQKNPRANVAWSDIRFGPIGTTVKV